MALLRQTRIRVQGLLSVLAWLGLCLPLLRMPMVITPAGTHCPTAPVQQVFDPEQDEIRKPEAGEEGFIQCLCAEKKAAEQTSSTPAPKQASAELVPISPMQSWADCPFMPIFRPEQAVPPLGEFLAPAPGKAPPTPPPVFI